MGNVAEVGSAVSADGVRAFATGSYPIFDAFKVYGKVGISYLDIKIDDSQQSAGEQDLNIAAGFGASYWLTEKIQLKMDIEWYELELADDAWTFSVGVSRRIDF